MDSYKIVVTPITSIVTPFQADTLFGSLCWALRYLWGEKKLEDFLEHYTKKPPLVLSDGLPEDFMPKPILKPMKHSKSIEIIENMYGKEKKGLVKGLTELKDVRKMAYIPEEMFEQLKNCLSEEQLLKKLLTLKTRVDIPSKDTIVFRNTINRLTGGVIRAGGLHPGVETFYDINIVIFLKTDLLSTEEIEQLFEFIASSGFGKSKSSGKGSLRLERCEKFSLSGVEDPNAFMSLSSFVPSKNDPIEGHYETVTKYGKLGGDYAKYPIPGIGHNPFKKPIIMFKAGSIFYDKTVREYYGRMIDNVHYDERIKHYGYAFPLGVRLT